MYKTVLTALLLATPAAAQMDSMILANSLGSVIGSEKPCGLSYKQDAIAAYIDANAPKDDMGFAQNMTMMVTGTEYSTKSLSPSAKTAHCAAIANSARHFGFID